MSTNNSSYQVYLSVGVAHVADYAAVLHFVQMFPHHHIFVAFEANPSSFSVSLHFMRADESAVTCAGDDHVHLSDHFLHVYHAEAVHAKKTQR